MRCDNDGGDVNLVFEARLFIYALLDFERASVICKSCSICRTGMPVYVCLEERPVAVKIKKSGYLYTSLLVPPRHGESSRRYGGYLYAA